MAYNTMRNSSGFQGDIESGFSPELNGDIPGNIVLGIQGPPGGYYTPSVSQPDASTMRIRHTASKSDMPGINATDVTLPPGPKGDPFTFEDFTPEQLEVLRGPKGNAFTYEDFTPEQLENLRGEPGEPGKDGTVSFDELTEAQKESLKGDPFRYEDFTAEQLAALKGEPGTPGKDGYTPKIELLNVVENSTSGDTRYGVNIKVTNVNDDGTESVMLATVWDGNKGAPGDDYVLTPADKVEIAEMAAELVEVPEPDSGGNVDLTGVTEYHASNNLYDPENLVGTHTINGSSVSGLSNWIPVKAKTKYVSSLSGTQYYFFDTEKNYLSGASWPYTPLIVTAPQDGYLLIKTNGKTDTVVVEGTDLGNHYEGYYALRESMTKRVSKADNNTWVGKKWLAIGDSLTDPQYADKGYPYLVSKALGLTLTNVGASGKVMNYFVDLIPDYADDFDLVTVLLGSNNQGYNCPIGSLNDGVDYNTNNSFCAQAQKVAEVLMAKYPAAVIAFMTPIRRTGVGDSANNNNNEGYYTNALGLTTEPYAEAVKEVADYYGLPCLDLYHNGINPKSEWMRKLYFVNADGTHPNNAGHAKYTAPVIKAFLESLAPFGERVVVEPDIPEPDEPGTDEPITTYTVTNTLTNAVNSNNTASVEQGASYSATITANDGYELDSVKVTMGGTDISASAVSGGTITIARVTGNIVITATATKTETDSGEAVLVHSYIGNSVPEDNVLKDQTGTFDLPPISGATIFGANYSTSDALAIEAGDSISLKFVNAMRNTVYYTQSVGVDTSGRPGIHMGINGSTDTDGRVSVTLGGKPSDGGTFGDGTIACGYRTADNNLDSIDSGITWVKGDTHTVTVTVNTTDNTMKLYVDGSFAGEKVMTSNLQVDGLTVTVRNEFPFDRLEVYKGIITDVG